MEHKKNKSSLKEITSAIQGFYFLVKFGLAFIYILKSYRKKYSSIFLRKNMFNSLLAFFFWKVCIFSSFERFSSPIFSLLSFICLPKWIRSERYFFFFLQDIGRGITKTIFTVLKQETMFSSISIKNKCSR